MLLVVALNFKVMQQQRLHKMEETKLIQATVLPQLFCRAKFNYVGKLTYAG